MSMLVQARVLGALGASSEHIPTGVNIWAQAKRGVRTCVVVVDEGACLGGPPAQQTWRLALLIDEAPVLRVLYRFLKNQTINHFCAYIQAACCSKVMLISLVSLEGGDEMEESRCRRLEAERLRVYVGSRLPAGCPWWGSRRQ